MTLYVDKLPKSCNVCKLSIKQGFVDAKPKIACGISKKCVRSFEAKLKACPLKELTNAQVAVGWFQEGKRVKTSLCEYDETFLHPQDCIENLVRNQWALHEEPQLTYTNWKGAREAVLGMKKVTILFNNSEWTLYFDNKKGRYLLTRNEVMDSSKKLAQVFYEEIVDIHYDSNEWKIWG